MFFKNTTTKTIGPGITVESESQIVTYESTGSHEKVYFLISTLLLIFGAFGIIWSFLSNMEVKYANVPFYIILFVFCIGFSILFYFKDYLKITFTAVTVVYFGILLIFSQRLNLGFNKVYNEIISLYNVRFNQNIMPKIFIEDFEYIGEAYFFLIVAAFLICWVLSMWIIHRPKASNIFLIYLPFYTCETLLGFTPKPLALVLMVICIVGTALIAGLDRSYTKKGLILFSAPNAQYNFLDENEDYLNQMRVKVLLHVGGLLLVCLLAISTVIALPLNKIINANSASLQRGLTESKFVQLTKDLYTPFAFLFGDRAVGGIGDGSLGNIGQVTSTGEPALTVTMDKMPNETIYLRAFVGEDYKGNRWNPSSSENKFFAKNKLNPLTMDRYSLTNIDPDFDLESLLCSMTIENINANNLYRYIPYNSNIRDEHTEDSLPINVYSTNHYNSLAMFNMRYDKITSLSETELLYQDFVRKTYLELPKKGLEKLTAQCEALDLKDITYISLYIQQTLHKDTTYSLSPGTLPKGKDFAEYFLYEQKEGFCNHYATTATLMFRMFGIPSRFVMGYSVPADSFEEITPNRFVGTAIDANAHAWTEIYIDEYGWIPFEATPGSMYDVPPPVFNPDAAKEEAEKPQEEVKTEPTKIKVNPVLVLAVIGLVLFVIFVVITIRILRFRIKRLAHLKDGNERADIRQIYKHLYSALLFVGLPKKSNFTQEELFAFVQKKLPFLSKEEFTKLMGFVLAANYSQKTLTQEHAQYVQMTYYQCCRSIYEQLPFMQRIHFRLLKGFPCKK